jgi:macrolide phosphotransferase
VGVDRTPSYLAALASVAVPGLDPVSVEALPSLPEQDFDVAFVQDSEHRRWVIRAPRTAAAGAQMEQTVPLLGMLTRRLPFAVPAPRGFIEIAGGGRAVVYPYLPGHNLDLAELPAGPGLAAELGRAIAALHNTDVRVFDEAGMPAYDADGYRARRLADLDRAAATGRVPTALLARWERALEDVALWRFAPTPTHGDLTGDEVLAVFDDDSDASTGRIRAVVGWEDAKVADPADDFASLVRDATPEALETVMEGYAHARVERPDPNLLVRARLAAELMSLAELMRAIARGDSAAVEGLTTQLRRLDDHVHAEAEAANDYRRTSLEPVALRSPRTPPPVLEDTDEDDAEDDVAWDAESSVRTDHVVHSGDEDRWPVEDEVEDEAPGIEGGTGEGAASGDLADSPSRERDREDLTPRGPAPERP